jgi:Ca2+-binding RTX toxin-like protein
MAMAILIRSGYSAFSYDYSFSTWGSQFGSLGDAGFNYERFFGIGGDQPLSVPFSIGGPVNVWLPFIGDTELFRARLFGELGATFGINIIAEMNLGQPDPLNPDEPTPGSIEVVLPYALSYAFPILDPVLDDGDIIDLYFDASFEPGPGAGFQTLFPSLVFELQLVAGLDVLLGAEFGVLGKNRTITVLDFSADTVVPLVSIDTARKDALGDADPVNLFGVTTQELIEDIPGIEPAFDFNGEFAGIKIPFNQFFSAPKTKEKPKAETETSGSNPPEEEQREPPDPAGLDLGSIELLIPNINTVSTYADGIFVTDPNRRLLNGEIVDVDNTNNPLNAGNRADIAALTLDIDGILTYATGGVFPPLEYNFPPIGGSVAGANFSAAFSYNLFDVELRAGLPLVQEFTMTPALDTRLKFFEANPDGSKSDTAKAVEVVQIVKALLFDENGTFQSDAVAARLQQLAAGNERVAQDVDLFVDFAAGIPGAFTGQTASIGGRMVVSRDDGVTWTELFTNAGEPIALSAPILGEDQTVELDLSGITFGYKIFRDDEPVPDEIIVIDFDGSDSIYRLEERTQISALFETPFLDDLDVLNLQYDGAQTYVEVENRVKPTITNRTGLEFDLSLLLQGLAASADFYASVDLGPVTIGGGFGVELGPLFSKRYPLFNADIVDFYNNSFQLTQSRTDSFVLGGIAPESSYGSAIVGTAGDDTDLRGTAGNDTLIGLAGNDNLYGEAGDDVLFGGLGNNFIYGGAGYDTADFTDLPSILISLNNTVRDGYRNGDRAGVLANLAVDFFYVETVDSEGRRVHKSSLHEIERLRLTDSKDRFTMTVMGDLQQHVQVPEIIELLEGDDSAYIRVQNTDLEARGLTLLAGKGDDTVVVYMLNGYTTDWSQFLFDGGEGIDSLIITDLDDNNWSRFVDLSTGNAAGAQIRNFEDVRIDGITGLDYSITGNELDNVLGGGNGNDVIRGLAGNDILNGNAGDDLLIGGPGADQINGGSGYDTVSFADAPTSVYITFANGAMRGYRGEAQGDVYTGIERFVGSAFDDIMIGFGGAYRLEGGDGNDRLMAQAGNDHLIGGRGDDLLAAAPASRTQTFNNVYDGGEGFDIVALSVWEPFTQTSSITGKGTYTYRQGSTFSSSSTSSVRDVTVDIRYLRSAHVDVTLDENGNGLVRYVEDDARSRVYATDISGTAIYSHAEPRSIADLFPPYRTKTVSFDNNITDQLLPNLLNDSISFTRDSSLSNNNGTGKITSTGSPPSAARGGEFATEQLYGIEGLIGSKGNDKLNGNNQDNALFGGGGADLIKSGGGNDRLGFGEGQPLADVFSFPGDNGSLAPGGNSTVYLTLEQRLQYINPEGTEEFRFGINLAPVGKIIINSSGGTQDVGSFLWGQGGVDTLDMRHDRGISFFPDYSDNYAVVDLNIASANAPINNFTGERIQYGRAEWFNGAGCASIVCDHLWRRKHHWLDSQRSLNRRSKRQRHRRSWRRRYHGW